MTQSQERELKFETGTHTAVPDLSSIPGVSTVLGPDEVRLHATYFDTADLDLIRAKITLRHRTGGSDEGWHLKLPPAKGARTEVHEALSPLEDGPPPELLAMVRSRLRGGEVRPIAEIINNRRTCRLADQHGEVLAEVTDDAVTARSLRADADQESKWREWEAELGSGDENLLQAIRRCLLDAGAHDSPVPSKLARALGTLPEKRQHASFDQGTAGGLVLDALLGHIETFKAFDPRVRLDEDDSVHQMRVAARRIRSIIRAYRRVFDTAVADPVESELQWIARVLGAARDAEVMAERLQALIDEQPRGSVPRAVQQRLVGGQHSAYRDALDDVLKAFESDRYFALIGSLDTLVTRTAFARNARKPADEAVTRALGQLYRKAKQTEQQARSAKGTADHDPLLHKLRKQCKRLRYAGELVSKAHNSRDVHKYAKQVRKAAETLQETLGEHQDGVITRALLDEAARLAEAAGEDTAAYETLARHEQDLADAAVRRYRPQWQALKQKTGRSADG
ncbi:CYTH and CHAD domain-containing protein [Hoyosella sp. YIM 151337]|uniref:CYTH and CHAD domain-containing protein n=1 Tax=Hoyosella sp. YIM 151337 TaxID=2992742 RepID=UPI0022360A8B|nr:CYTH and CHAD domain-containing protein [Hoyosella sp. YIM 151337]MCW4355351.1 CYTH and CHAD domain-containing protein [Hoyosella sp. YIM 151337]